MKTIVRFVALMVAIGTAQPAMAQMNRQEVRSACMGDYRRLCSGVMPGGGRIIACLSEHMPELNPACANAIGAAEQCFEDYKKLCPNVSPGNGRVRACLMGHERQLSSACAAALRRR